MVRGSFQIFSQALRNRKQSAIAPIPSTNSEAIQVEMLIESSLGVGAGRGGGSSRIQNYFQGVQEGVKNTT